MKLKTLFVALVLAIAPSLSIAECTGDHSTQAMSCVEGQVWDAATGLCVNATT